MIRLHTFCGVIVATAMLCAAPALADDASDQLAEGIQFYDASDYQGAYEILRDLEQAALTTEDAQLQYQRYLALSRKAVDAMAAAEGDFTAATQAMNADQLEGAKRLFERVIENEYASVNLVSRAQEQLREITRRKAARPAEQPAPRPGSGVEQMTPVEPAAQPASEGPRKVEQPQHRAQPAPPPSGGLVDDLAREHELLWQKADAVYKDAAQKIKKAVLNEDFAEAKRLMEFARQTIELNRRYATPPSRYEDLRGEAEALAGFIEDEQRLYDERIMREKRRAVIEREDDRRALIAETKARQVSSLMDQAAELRKEQKFDDAIEVLKQVLAVEPDNTQAAWMKETLEDIAMHVRDREADAERQRQFQDMIIETEEARIPWHENIRYPKNWPELTARRAGVSAEAEPEATRQVRRALQNRATELKFDAIPLEEVIGNIQSLTGLNIVPNWSALEFAAIDRDIEITLSLRDVTYEKALELVLDAAGGGEIELAYEIDDGVIQISTKEDLARRTATRVYNVQDLIISVPTFRGRNINIEDIGQNQGQQGGLGGGRFLQGGGLGGGGGGAGGGGGGGGNLFQGGGQRNEDEDIDQGDPIEPIIELIQQTIDPESWRAAGGNVGSIQPLNQQLVVTQTSTAHNQIRDLLRQLRQARALQIAVEARYLTISRNWLEQIGVDLDIILNNGNAGFDRTTILNPATNNPILVPREFTRLGFAPGAPGGVGINMPTQPFGSPFGQPGLVPAPGDVGPHSSQLTPIPIVNNTLDLAAPISTNVPGSLASVVNDSPAFQIFGSFLDNIQVDFLLRASQVDRRASDLDAPRLVLFNGQRATFEAFIEQDFIAALTPVIGDNAGAFLPQVDTALTGRSLDVQATVSADRRYVTMTVRTFTRVTGDFRTVFFGGSQTVGSGFIELATQTTQQIRTTVSVPDGGTLLIGGLKLSGERDTDAGVPILSRIPILKRAFSNTSNVRDDQVLLILIKPTIIIQEEAEAEAFPTLASLSDS